MKSGLIIGAVIAATVAGGLLVTSGDARTNDARSVDSSGLATVDDQISHPSETAGRKRAAEGDRPVPSKRGPWPVAYVESSAYDFGRMAMGDQSEQTFTIENRGEATLNLCEGKMTCNCTAFFLSKTSIEPGESSILTLKWKPKNTTERFRHGGPVYTDDPQNTKILFEITGRVDDAAQLLPVDVWDAGLVGANQAATMNAFIISRVHESFEVSSVDTGSPHVTAEVSEISASKLEETKALCGYKIVLTVSPDIPSGDFQSLVSIHADCLDDPMQASLRASRAGPVRVQALPGTLWIESSRGLKVGSFQASKGHRTGLMLMIDKTTLPDNTEFKLETVKIVPSYLETRLTPMPGGSEDTARYRLDIVIPPDIPKTVRSSANPARLEFRTNHPEDPSFSFKMSYKAF